MVKYVFVTGGVISGIGKGVICASIGAILKMSDDKIRFTIKKLDPYLNVDPGTMNPFEHGEVFVTNDGTEADLDLGYYERFTGIETSSINSTSSGRLYMNLLEKERNGHFLGKTVQTIPHFTNEIKQYITEGSDKFDIIICEIGGSIGDLEAHAFYETLRQLKNEIPHHDILFVHVTYIIHMTTTNELKTKPTQNAIKELNSAGIYPDILVCRLENNSDLSSVIDKLALHTNVAKNKIIISPNVNSIYEIPLKLVEQNLDQILFEHFNIYHPQTQKIKANTKSWDSLLLKINNSSRIRIKIGIIGKYVELHDAYKSLIEAIDHACYVHEVNKELVWIDCRKNISESLISDFDTFDGFIVPGGFGNIGINNMIKCIENIRIKKKPLFGICLGMQLICIEYARNICGVVDAGSQEFDDKEHIVKIMIDDKKIGGTMRLGSHTIKLKEKSKIYDIYGKKQFISERHRHRYDLNPEFVPILEKNGLNICGVDADNDLVEIVELLNTSNDIDHFYIGCQYHPEYKSTPMNPHPLFLNFVKACL